MKTITIVSLCVFLLACKPTSTEEYLQIRKICYERKGQYFMLMTPSMFGNRIVAGCLEESYK